jgi:hypothetical protein
MDVKRGLLCSIEGTACIAVEGKEMRARSCVVDRDHLVWARQGSEVRTVLFCVITQRVLVIPYRRFGTTYWSHFQGSKIQKDNWLYQYECM